MKRAERLVAIAFVVAIVAALALFVVYIARRERRRPRVRCCSWRSAASASA